MMALAWGATVYLLTRGKHIIWMDAAKTRQERDTLPVFSSSEKAAAYVATFSDLADVEIKPFLASWVRDYILRKDLAHVMDHPGRTV
jgi:hypothetical protein